jgi:hypothetical protein
MILESDIGIDINGLMYVLFKQGINLPSEESFVIDIKNDTILYFYQGQRVYVKDNKLIGKLQLINAKSGRFELKCVISNTLKIIINDYTEEYSFINDIDKNELIDDKLIEEEKIRNLDIAKTKYINYINQTICTLEQIKDKIDPYLIYKIKEAYEIIYVDITVEEYEAAQKQIEGWVNPILENISFLFLRVVFLFLPTIPNLTLFTVFSAPRPTFPAAPNTPLPVLPTILNIPFVILLAPLIGLRGNLPTPFPVFCNPFNIPAPAFLNLPVAFSTPLITFILLSPTFFAIIIYINIIFLIIH